jgi:hypothetical protein
MDSNISEGKAASFAYPEVIGVIFVRNRVGEQDAEKLTRQVARAGHIELGNAGFLTFDSLVIKYY